MAVVHSYVPPERFVVGTVGQPGSRTFFLQARSGSRITSVSLEKQQVVALAERMDQLLDELLAQGTSRTPVPAVTPLALDDSEPLEQPLVEEFRAGTMTLSWDESDESVVVEVFPIELEDEAGEGGEESDESEEGEFEAFREGMGALEEEALPPGLADDLAEALADALNEEEHDEMLLVRMPAAQARAFAQRAKRVVDAGRPSCPFCGNPIDPSGHLCVRANGFRRRLT